MLVRSFFFCIRPYISDSCSMCCTCERLYGTRNVRSVKFTHIRYKCCFHSFNIEILVYCVDSMITAQFVSRILEDKYSASSMFFTIQDGKDAGQTVSHVHMHVMPRFKKDFPNNDDIYTKVTQMKYTLAMLFVSYIFFFVYVCFVRSRKKEVLLQSLILNLMCAKLVHMMK